VLLVAVLLVVVLVAGAVAWRLLGTRSPYEQAIRVLPAATLRTSFTDWDLVRQHAHGGSLGVRSPRSKVSAFLDRAYDRDLTNGSGLTESTVALGRLFGFSPLDAQWEALAQSRQGQVDVLRLDDDVDTAAVERSLRRHGYPTPHGGLGKGGVWEGGEDRVAVLSPDLTPLQQYVVVLGDQHLVLMSDEAAYLAKAARVATGADRSLGDVEGVSALASTAGDPAAAVQWTRSFACADLSMGSADDSDQSAADDLVARATRRGGRISPLDGLVVAQHADRSLVVGMHFETSEQATANLQPRVDLASGDAPGQGGTFADRFRIVSGSRSGQDVVLRMRPRGAQAVLSDLTSGPILFATC
jgi:hypothetical protein